MPFGGTGGPRGGGATKLKASVSRHKARSSGWVEQAEPKLAAEMKAWFRAAEAADPAEDAEHRANRRGDETPE